ncbi:MAG: deaminase [Candidatus Paceibacterota bacterium]|jgi:dCMP deaminase
MEKLKPLSWIKDVDPDVLAKMLPHKIDINYQRPSMLDIFAMEAIIWGQRSTCLFNEVGAVIFQQRRTLSTAYNGPAKGDVDPRDAGCARIIGGKLHEGGGHCRGTHAEMNAVSNLTISISNLEDVCMMVTLSPCYSCAKQLSNTSIKKIYYIWEYGRDPKAVQYLKDSNIELIKHTFPYLENFLALTGFTPPPKKHH